MYAFVRNISVGKIDILGLWDSDVHETATIKWAKELNVLAEYSNIIGVEDNRIDTIYSPKSLNSDNWSWHFDRSIARDSRLMHSETEMRIARRLCSNGFDMPKSAAREIGYALHPEQDWVAHGDYNRIEDTPALTWFQTDVQYYIHNYGLPVPRSRQFPDDITLDADGSVDGRATMGAMTGPDGGYKVLWSGDTVYWVSYHKAGSNSQRFLMTRGRTKTLLSGFQDYVKTQNNACECKCAFLGGP